jgi:hypothetical protein
MAFFQALRPLWVWGMLVVVWALAWWLQLELPALEYVQGNR